MYHFRHYSLVVKSLAVQNFNVFPIKIMAVMQSMFCNNGMRWFLAICVYDALIISFSISLPICPTYDVSLHLILYTTFLFNVLDSGSLCALINKYMYIYKYHYWIFEEFNCNIHVLYFYDKYNSKTLTNLGSNWQQTRLDFDYETVIICLRFWLWMSIKSADKLPANW